MNIVDQLPSFSGLVFTFSPSKPMMITVGEGDDRVRIKLYRAPHNNKYRVCIEKSDVPVLVTKEDR